LEKAGGLLMNYWEKTLQNYRQVDNPRRSCKPQIRYQENIPVLVLLFKHKHYSATCFITERYKLKIDEVEDFAKNEITIFTEMLEIFDFYNTPKNKSRKIKDLLKFIEKFNEVGESRQLKSVQNTE
jgi:hypothetical protein